MHIVAEAQRNGGICAYVDAEHAMDPIYAKAIGVDTDNLLRLVGLYRRGIALKRAGLGEEPPHVLHEQVARLPAPRARLEQAAERQLEHAHEKAEPLGVLRHRPLRMLLRAASLVRLKA